MMSQETHTKCQESIHRLDTINVGCWAITREDAKTMRHQTSRERNQ